MLAGKVVLVTGASSGIGAEAARVFAREGARVVLTARTTERLAEVTRQITTEGGAASYVAGDISAADDVERIIDAVLNRHGRLDGAFNNAGISQGGTALADIEEERFDRVFAVNVRGVWLSMRAEIRALLAAGSPGSIVNTSSVGGLRGGAQLSAYSASKHAVIGLTRSAAQEYGEHGIRVNVIAPGTTDTPMIAAWKRREPDITQRLNAATPLGRGAHPAEVSQAATWLLSDRASYVSGATLAVDGGMTA
ncbi:SDR family NAD(P)-dependent oxidoreductase [Rugosimonospora africana]|uniref:2,5-dichloro-2,5-cyclohexadiene-1,4-diol dehydrogenase n=1 Tax=Rugosimonospora africana TaxID=556532 RepID=A0A8J3VRQ4_9ACTN|nr:glucose 1-dehydrogenase [Rugosimonospora africana]GIH16359.1 2,5-dichloro-2,5-cyclohexadiene-1,4-diol dehydrogenase [Rugosimonospora africana]